MADGRNESQRDLSRGVRLEEIPDGGCIQGQVGDEDAILVRRGQVLYAVGAWCSHHHGPLADGMFEDQVVFCPWHNACFDLRNGQPVEAPVLEPISCWRVERVGDVAFVREKMRDQERSREVGAPPS